MWRTEVLKSVISAALRARATAPPGVEPCEKLDPMGRGEVLLFGDRYVTECARPHMAARWNSDPTKLHYRQVTRA